MAEILSEQVEETEHRLRREEAAARRREAQKLQNLTRMAYGDSAGDKKTSAYSSHEAGNGDKAEGEETKPKRLLKGVVLGKDGKPCRSCTSIASWAALTKKKLAADEASSQSTPTTTSTVPITMPADCPPDVEALGRSSWTLLHSITATYPERATPTQQTEMRQFLSLFTKLYPCWVCGEEFAAWMSKKKNEPPVEGRDGLGDWMCRAHNAVNKKLGKPEFDCAKWQERWRTGWKDGRCD
ncbi:MAG: hypothetical protein M1819_006783 [Sarea resinae]|nr:MAG: hypothetical protein M1819_006783 [Sarea resinae]